VEKPVKTVKLLIIALILSTIQLFAIDTIPGTALQFDAVDEYVNVGNDTSLNVGNVLTIEAWVNPSDLSSRYGVFSTRKDNTAGAFQLEVGTGSGGVGRVAVTGSGTYIAETEENAIAENEWNHIVYTRSGSGAGTHKIYVNGVEQTLTSDDPYEFIDNSSEKVIASGTSGGQFFPGKMDEVRFWNVARSAEEIQDNMYIPLSGTEDGLVSYWQFNDSTGSVLSDCVGLNSGTLVNMEEEDWVDSGIILSEKIEFDPDDNMVNVPLDTDLTIAFSTTTYAGTGNIELRKSEDDSLVETIPAINTSITDSVVQIDLTNDLEFYTDYYVLIDSLAFNDGNENYFDGIFDKEVWNFTTKRLLLSTLPVDNSVNIALDSDLILNFSKNIFAGTGNIELRKSVDDSIVETIPAINTNIIDSVVQIELMNDLELQTDYYVLIDSTAFMRIDSVYFYGIINKEEWNFRSLNFFTDINAGLTGVRYGSVAWGDYDNDGDLDILMTGKDYLGYSKIYRNDSGVFTDINAGLRGVSASSVAWGDYDNDGDLDILLTGYDSSWNGSSRIYRNDFGVFTDINAGLTGVYESSVAWGDYDNDGDLDILLAGLISISDSRTYIYRNDSGVFTKINAGLTGASRGSVAWGDYDNDGDLDILLAGDPIVFPQQDPATKIYQNNSGVFTDINARLTDVWGSSVAWGVYDNDGDLDILLAGIDHTFDKVSKVYRNDSGSFTDINAGLTGVAYSSLAWGDYDNDGDIDILLTGYTGTAPYRISKIYRNDTGIFTETSAELPGVDKGSVAWGDYDNDGDLDILLTGLSENEISKIYKNNSLIANTAPNLPTNLSLFDIDGHTSFSWDKATDSETHQDGLTYNINLIINDVNTTPAMADSTGFRKIVAIGNAGQNCSYISRVVKKLLPQEPEKIISWKVQAIDNCYAGSEFASADTTFLSMDLKLITFNEMGADDPLSWEYVFEDSIIDYNLQIDDDANFGSPFEETVLLDKKSCITKGTTTYFDIALNELTIFDSLVSNTRYYWRVKPNYIYRTSRYPAEPSSFIFNPTYSVPSPIEVNIEGNLVTLTWNNVKDAEKGEVYNVYSTDDPYAVFPTGWKYEGTVNDTQWFTVTSELKKFYCVTATGVTKEEDVETRSVQMNR
jgi:predicted nucleotidyltransferase